MLVQVTAEEVDPAEVVLIELLVTVLLELRALRDKATMVATALITVIIMTVAVVVVVLEETE